MRITSHESRVTPSTFDIAAADLDAGEFGVAVASKFLAVGAVVPWAQAGAGAIATQAWANLSYGPRGLALLAEGHPTEDVLHRLVESDGDREHRQVGVVDRRGQAAAWTGNQCLHWAGDRFGTGWTCQGDILAADGGVRGRAGDFEVSSRPLPERLGRGPG